MKKTIILIICVVILLAGFLIINANSLFIDEEQRIEEIKEEALVQAKEYIREALIKESEYTSETITALDNVEVSYGVEALEDKIYTVAATYKYRLELSHVHMDIYYVCEIAGDLRTKDVTVNLVDYYTSDPEIKVDPKQIYTNYCNSEWATYESGEYSDKIIIDTNPDDVYIEATFTAKFIDSKKWYNEEADIAIQSINAALGLPKNLRDKIVNIGATDPAEYEYFYGYIGYDDLRVAYTFHPNKGLVVQYSFSK